MRIGPVEIPRWLLLLVITLVVISSGSCSCGVLGQPEGDTQRNIDWRLSSLSPDRDRIPSSELGGDCRIGSDMVTFSGSCDVEIEPAFALRRRISLQSVDAVRVITHYEAANSAPSETLPSSEPLDAIVGFNEGLTVTLVCVIGTCTVVLE